MKNLILINGTMGVGKTETSRDLQKRLNKCVFLDGDWCWDMNPLQITEETKKVAMDNLTFMLRNFLNCSAFENVVFCWDMHKESIIEEILDGLKECEYKLHKFSLVCTEEALAKRIGIDFAEGRRTENILEKSLVWMHNYDSMDTVKVDVTSQSSWQASVWIAEHLNDVK